ncbi:MAG: ATP-binding protein [Gemmatimonadaceae bacterium]|nr:ATP-binding protein [Gemmatimonadaceae bacterium]
MTLQADATPTKRFFIDNLTRDLTLEDAILDLVDNSIDAFIRTRNIDVSPALLRGAIDGGGLPASAPAAPPIKITVNANEIVIADRCGGIAVDRAETEVFRIGRVDSEIESALGVYGIGLKRAIFKIGRDITIQSHTENDGFLMRLDVNKWAGEDSWMIPFEVAPKAKSKAQAGTTITIRKLTPEVLLRIKDPVLMRRLFEGLSSTYTLFLGRFLHITLNDKPVAAKPLPLGSSADLEPAFRELTFGDVKVELFAGLAGRKAGEWNIDRAGWYVLCNGRVVVHADKTETTGWGLNGPQFVSKYRGFVGIAFFFSENPASLPWTTTKRGLNQESEAYLRTRLEMMATARPVLTFLNNMYPSEPAPDVAERTMVDKLTVVDLRSITAKPNAAFTAKVIRQAKKNVSVQYSAPLADVEQIKKKINKPSMGAGAVGLHTFKYFLRMECAE